MDKREIDKLGKECVEHLIALNPRGSVKDFVRLGVEFGYNVARKKDIEIIKRQFKMWSSLANNTSDESISSRAYVLGDLLESMGVHPDEIYKWEQEK